MKHWTPKAYLKGRLISKGLNCLVAANHAEAAKLAYRYFAEDDPPTVFDRITVVQSKWLVCPSDNCSIWPEKL